MAQDGGYTYLPPHLRGKAASKVADAPALSATAATFTSSNTDTKSNGNHSASINELAVVPFGKAPRASRGDRTSAKDQFAHLEGLLRNESAKLAADNDEFHERCEDLETENDELKTRCANLAVEIELVRGQHEAAEREKDQVNTRYESLEVENKQHITEIRDYIAEIRNLKQQMRENEERLNEFERLAVVKTSSNVVKQEGFDHSDPTFTATSSGSLAKDQLEDVMKQLHASYAMIQHQAEEQASIRYKGVMDAQIDMHQKLEHRITAMETKASDTFKDSCNGSLMESVHSDTYKEVKDEINELKTSMVTLQPQCNKVQDALQDFANRLSALELQSQERIERQQQVATLSASKSNPPHLADTDYQTKTKIQALIEDVAKLKAFKGRMKTLRNKEHEINEANTEGTILQQYKRINKIIGSNGWETDNLQGLPMEDLEDLRDHALMRYATLDLQTRAVMDIKAKGMGGRSPLGDD